MEKKGKGNAKKRAELDAKFEKYAAMLTPEYKAQFKSNVPKTTKAQKIKQAVNTGRKVEVVSKGTGNKVNQINNVGKLLDEDVELKEVPKEIATQVQQARNEKKLSQDQLAKKISEPVAKISALEKCEGIYDPQLVVKIERALNVKFTRSWKK